MNLKYDTKKFEAFVWYHLTHLISKPVGDFHRELISALQHPRIAIAAPRGFSKSTWCSVFYPLYMALENPGINILIVSATGSLAEQWVAMIRKELETNDTLRQFYGDQDGSGKLKWTNERLELPNGTIILAKGAGRQIRGFRPDVIIGDDLETDEMVVSTDQRNKFDSWFTSTLTPTLKGGQGQIIVIGTILHPESFLAERLANPPSNWKTRFYQAIRPDGTSLWPEMYSIESLEALRDEMGTYSFAQEYMNDPVPDEFRTFQDKWFQHLDKAPEYVTYFTTIDPAIETGNTNDYTAIVTCGVDKDENIYVVDVVNKRLLPSEVIDTIFQVYKRYKPAVMGIETQGFQKMLKYELDKQKKERGLYPIIRELKHGGRRKGLRIEGLQPLYEAGKVYHCGGERVWETLETQLLRFPSPRCHDDIIDALAYQLDIVRAGPRKAVKINPESFLATLERRRQKTRQPEVWGNHKLRNKI